MAYDNQPGSESTDGKQIAVAAIATPGTLLHTATAGSKPDAITIHATNIDTVDQTLTIEWGGVTDADQIIVGIPPKTGYILVINGRLLKGGLDVRAFAEEANKINCNISVISST
jgi:hypothetical protein|tara:strand:+ start:3216 stop:3557 length:342 start_codon:yes stop_codon:yes gene_type:complete